MPAWLLPHTWQRSSRELARLVARAAGRNARLWSVPDWLVRLAGSFGGELSGVPEMLYQWHAPFIVDDARFRARFALDATPVATNEIEEETR